MAVILAPFSQLAWARYIDNIAIYVVFEKRLATMPGKFAMAYRVTVY